MQVLTVSHTPFAITIPQGDGSQQNTPPSQLISAHQAKRLPLLNDVNKWSKCTAAQAEVHVAVSETGELLLHRPLSPLPVSRATQTQRAVSSIRRFRLQCGELEPLINAGRRDCGRQSYFLPFAIVSCYSYVHHTMHLIHTVLAFVCHCNSEQRRPNILLKTSVVAMANTSYTS